MSKVSIIIGSKSDRELGDKIQKCLKDFSVECEYNVLSAHRNPDMLDKHLQNSEADIYIAVAGLSAALPGYIASKTLKPVIGVPKNVKLGGLDSLLSIVQMPPGVPVACVGIDNGRNAALLALRILGLSDLKIKDELLKSKT